MSIGAVGTGGGGGGVGGGPRPSAIFSSPPGVEVAGAGGRGAGRPALFWGGKRGFRGPAAACLGGTASVRPSGGLTAGPAALLGVLRGGGGKVPTTLAGSEQPPSS